MKKQICMVLVVTVSMLLFAGCQKKYAVETEEKNNIVQNEEVEEKSNMPDGKKIIFVGNSFTYYGGEEHR